MTRRRVSQPARPSVEVTRSVAGEWCRWPLGVGSLLIAGVTGSGKSTVLRHLLCRLAARADVALAGVDLKLVELAPFADRFDGLAVERDDAVRLLREVAEIVRQRRGILLAAGAVEWRPAFDPWLIVCVDELAELVDAAGRADRRLADEARGLLVSIARTGRAVGVHLIGATQRPEAETLTGALRGQLDWRVGLRVRAPEESRMICAAEVADLTTLDAGGWSMWLPPLPGRVQLARSPLVTVEQARTVVAATAHLRHDLIGVTL